MTFKIKLDTIKDVQKLCEIASRCTGEIYAKSGRFVVDAKSIMGIFSLDLSNGFIIEIPDKDTVTDDIINELLEIQENVK